MDCFTNIDMCGSSYNIEYTVVDEDFASCLRLAMDNANPNIVLLKGGEFD